MLALLLGLRRDEIWPRRFGFPRLLIVQLRGFRVPSNGTIILNREPVAVGFTSPARGVIG